MPVGDSPEADYEFRARFHGGRAWQAWLASLGAHGQAYGGDLNGAADWATADDLLASAERIGLITRGGVHIDRNAAVRRAWYGMGYTDASAKEPARPIETVWVRGPNWRSL